MDTMINQLVRFPGGFNLRVTFLEKKFNLWKKIRIKKSEKHTQMAMHRKLELFKFLLITCEFDKLVGWFHFSIHLNICYFT